MKCYEKVLNISLKCLALTRVVQSEFNFELVLNEFEMPRDRAKIETMIAWHDLGSMSIFKLLVSDTLVYSVFDAGIVCDHILIYKALEN